MSYIHRNYITPNFIMIVLNLYGGKTLSLITIDVLLTNDTLYGLRCGTNFKPKQDMLLEDIALI